MKFKKINKKINKFIKKTNVLFCLISLCFCVLGIVFKYIDGLSILSMIMFLMATIFTGFPIFVRAIQGIISKTISIELLVTIAVIGAICIKEYSEAGIVTLLFQLGMLLELKTLEKTRNAIKKMINMSPTIANRINGDVIEEVDVDDLEPNDLLLVKTGDRIPADGYIKTGDGYFMESSITGEAVPVYKEAGDFIYSGSIMDNGSCTFLASRIGSESTYGKIIELVEEAEDSKSKIERFIDKFSKYYTPFVILLAISVLLIKWLITKELDIDTSITVLVLACPGALVIGVPIASVSGIGRAASMHILLKGGDSLHEFAKTDCFVFDKTGTLTTGNPKVLEVKYFGDNEKGDFAAIKSIEAISNHPLASAITTYFNNYDIIDAKIDIIKGMGVKSEIFNNSYIIGNERMLNNLGIAFDSYKDIIKESKEKSSSIAIVCKNNKVIMIILINDEIRKNAGKLINKLKKIGIKKTIMLTGDNNISAKAVSDQIGLDEYYSNLLPDEKFNKIKELQNNGYKVTFVGDGINDGPAIAMSNTGIAMGSGTDVAVETSDVVIKRNELEDLYLALKIARKTVRISIANIVIAVGTVILLLVGLFLGYIHMSIGMFIHEASILIVILNAMRLLLIKGDKK